MLQPVRIFTRGCRPAGILSFFLLLVTGADMLDGNAAQSPTNPRTGTLVIAGDVPKPITWKPADLQTLPRTAVTVQEEGRTLKYEGVLAGELLKRAGVPGGNQLRGAAVATYVLATANDGYQVVFSLAELDPAFTESRIIVADRVDGKPLVESQGPLRIVAPGDAHGARSIRMLERLDVVRLRK
jgi:DMSO/TMAO reductase YedYZ molybdopterin-dependent catalytic subunit